MSDIYIDIKSLPTGWSLTSIESFADVLMGQSPPSETYNDEGIGLPFFQGKAEFTELHPVVRKWCDASNKIAEPKDILMSVRAPVGATNIANVKCCIGRGLSAIRYSQCNKFLFYFFRLIENKLDEKGTGTTFRAISGDVIKNAQIFLPPLTEQRRIVAKIEALFSSLDRGIESLKTAQAQLKVYRQAVLKWAFEGRFGLFRLGSIQVAQRPPNQVKEGELPEGWEKKMISEVAELNPPLPNKENIDRNLEVQFIPMKLVEEIVNKIHLTETRKFADVLKGSYTPFIDGDIIFAKVTPCMENGKIAIVNHLKNGIGFGSSEFHVLRCSEQILNRYLHRFIVQDVFRNKAQRAMTGAVGLRRVPKQFIENYIIPNPPTIAEQEKIIEEIESRLSVCDKIEESISASLLQAEALRQSILKKAFEGRLLNEAEANECRNDPAWEPASVLLERIRAERENNKPVRKGNEKKGKLKKH